ncbi:MAG TPA: polyphosphate kinase 2 family protein [Ignavibacteria bacterium]|nr:polyphosphate kinase 2 family protein [Ignavibacteria bacterium]
MYQDTHYLIPEGTEVNLKNYDPEFKGDYKSKKDAEARLEKDITELKELQEIFYASNQFSLLIVLQAIDTAGKDGVIKHVMSGLNPSGVTVHGFKAPTGIETEHDFLWRCNKVLPPKGNIAIFNRSHYEEVLVTRVHPEYILKQGIPGITKVEDIDKKFWQQRYEQINNFEKTLTETGTHILKFFLYLSKDEQKKRFLDRIDTPDKNWKFSSGDIKERGFWDEYMKAYEEALSNTSKKKSPWFIIPANNKWYSRLVIANIIKHYLKDLNLTYPKLDESEKEKLSEVKNILLSEK